MSDATQAREACPTPSAGVEPPSAPPPLMAVMQGLVTELRGALHGRLHLVTLELQQASLAATQIVMLATLAALMVCSAWGTLLVGIYLGSLALGLPWPAALLVVLLVNVLAAIGSWVKATSLTVHFTFPGTMRMLKGLPPTGSALTRDSRPSPSNNEILKDA